MAFKTFHTTKIMGNMYPQSAGSQQGCEKRYLPVGGGATRGHKSTSQQHYSDTCHFYLLLFLPALQRLELHTMLWL